jgi:predicted AAA+ superfamily ATPase
MIKRQITTKLLQLAQAFPVVALTGPRQSGKTTLVRHAFPDKKYATLEDPDLRAFAVEDPRGFLASFPDGAVFDEVQRAPQLFSYLQGLVDEQRENGRFILTGSQNFLLQEKISQTLAGRVATLKLLPFSLQELKEAGRLSPGLEEMLFRGFYPRLYDQPVDPLDWYPNYIQTYVERDVRQLKNINDIDAFQRFVKLCAGRTGQIVNLSSLGNDCGITHNTTKAWLAVLEASFIIHSLRPYYNNFNKRFIKSPKLYFYDPGLACALLGIETKTQLTNHYLKGGLFETLVIGEIIKSRFNMGREANCYYWRNKLGNEVDCLLEREGCITAVEIKSGRTVAADWFDGLKYWQKISGQSAANSFLVYGGSERQQRNAGQAISWMELADLLKK